MMKRQFTLLLAVFLVSNFALSTLIVSLSNRAQNQRKANNAVLEEQRETAKKTATAVLAFECILKYQPPRAQSVIDECKVQAAKQLIEE